MSTAFLGGLSQPPGPGVKCVEQSINCKIVHKNNLVNGFLCREGHLLYLLNLNLRKPMKDDQHSSNIHVQRIMNPCDHTLQN